MGLIQRLLGRHSASVSAYKQQRPTALVVRGNKSTALTPPSDNLFYQSPFQWARRSITGLLEYMQTLGSHNKNYYRNVVPVYASIRAICMPISSLSWGLWQYKDDLTNKQKRYGKDARDFRRKSVSVLRNYHARVNGKMVSKQGGDMVPVNVTPEVDAALAHTSSNITGNNFFYSLAAWLCGRGEFFVLLQDANGDPITPVSVPEYLVIVNPSRMHEEVNEEGALTGWTLKQKGGKLTRSEDVHYPTWAVMTSRLFSFENPYRGVGPLEPASMAAESTLQSKLYNLDVLQNDASPSLVVIYDQQVDPEVLKQRQESFDNRHRGNGKKGRVAFMDNGPEITPLNVLSHQALQLLEQEEFRAKEIYQAYGVPESIVLNNAANYATAQEHKRTFYEGTIMPLATLIEIAINDFIVGPITGYRYVFAFDWSEVKALDEAFSDKLNQAKMLWDMQYPANMINERLGLGMEELAWGNTRLVPYLNIPIDELFESMSPWNRDLMEAKQDQQQQDADVSGKTLIYSPKAGKLTIKSFNDPEYVQQLEQRVIAPMFNKSRKKIQRYMFELRNEIIANADRYGEALTEDAVFDIAVWNNTLQEMMDPLYMETIDLNNLFSQDELGVTIGTTDPRVIDLISQREPVLSGINSNIRQRVAAIHAEGIRQGASTDEIRAAITRFCNTLKQPYRTGRIATTELGIATSTHRNNIFQEAEYTKHKWLHSPNIETVRPSHKHYQTVGVVEIGFNFRETWKDSSGTLTHPHDPNGPVEEIVNCHCHSRPVE